MNCSLTHKNVHRMQKQTAKHSSCGGTDHWKDNMCKIVSQLDGDTERSRSTSVGHGVCPYPVMHRIANLAAHGDHPAVVLQVRNKMLTSACEGAACAARTGNTRAGAVG